VEKGRSKFLTLLGVAMFAAALTLMMIMSVQESNARQQLYTGKENHSITLDQAVKYIQNFRSKPAAPTIKGAYFGRSVFDKMLSQSGCIGIRYYYAATDSGVPTIVVVGVDSTGNDLVNGVLAEMTIPCPPFCPAPNALFK
jgi:hypothetical protein